MTEDTYRILGASTREALQILVNGEMRNGWRCEGSPFYHEESREWCQAVTRLPGMPAGQVRLKEQKR